MSSHLATPRAGASKAPTGRRIDALLWDNDGVLVDTEPLYLRANQETLAEIGIELGEDVYRNVSLRQGRSVFDLAADRGVTKDEIDTLRHRRNERYTALLDAGVEVLDGVRESLEHFWGRLPMGIVTSSQPDHFERIHRHTGLLGYFDFVLASGDYLRHKPHPDPYLTGAARHGHPPGRCLAIEDTERGLSAARAAGMPCIVIPRPLSEAGDFTDALHVLDSARELPLHVDALGHRPEGP